LSLSFRLLVKPEVFTNNLTIIKEENKLKKKNPNKP
jgi:hypothetical protein